MAQSKTMYFAGDGKAFDTEQAADAHDAALQVSGAINAFADYQAQMQGKGPRIALQIATMLSEYESSKVTGVPKVPEDIIARNEQAAADAKAKREARKAGKSGKAGKVGKAA